LWYNDWVGTSIRIASVILLLAVAGGRVSTVVCEIACLDGAPVSPQGVLAFGDELAAHGCHESASEPLGDASRVAPRSDHSACRNHISAPFVLTAKFVRNAPQSSAPADSTFCEVSNGSADDRQPRELTPPGLDRAPIVTLRI
jgi:hypothetical protein